MNSQYSGLSMEKTTTKPDASRNIRTVFWSIYDHYLVPRRNAALQDWRLPSETSPPCLVRSVSDGPIWQPRERVGHLYASREVSAFTAGFSATTPATALPCAFTNSPRSVFIMHVEVAEAESCGGCLNLGGPGDITDNSVLRGPSPLLTSVADGDFGSMSSVLRFRWAPPLLSSIVACTSCKSSINV